MKFLKQDVLYAVRQFRKNPTFTIVTIATLALGIGANAAFFGVINATILRPLPYPAERLLLHLNERSTKAAGVMPVSYPDFLDWKREQTCFSALTIYRTGTAVNVRSGTGTERMSTVMVDSDFLKVMGYRPLMGRDLQPEDDRTEAPLTILLPYSTWTRHFNSDANVIGRGVDVDGRTATIVGVLPAGFNFFARSDLVMALGPFVERLYLQARASHSNARAVGRLKPGISLSAAQSEMNAVAAHLAEQYPQSNSGIGIEAVGLHEYLTGAAKQRQLLLMGAVGLVLLIVCVNIATLFFARACAREREMAIRTALGAARPRLVRQVMVESLLMASTGGVLGLAVAAGLTAVLESLVPYQLLQLNAGRVQVMDWRVLVFTLAVTLLSGLAFGLMPSLQLARPSLNEILKDHSATRVPVHHRIRSLDLLVVAQVSSAALLLITAGLFLRSLWSLSNRPLGFQPEKMLSLHLASPSARLGGSPIRIAAFYREAEDRLAKMPGVEAAAVTSNFAFGFNDSHNQFRLADRPAPSPEDYPSASFRIVSADYFRTMGIPLLQGRVFSDMEPMPSLPAGAPAMKDAIAAMQKLPMDVIVTQSFAQHYWPGQSPVGKHILLGPPSIQIATCTVVGVVGDTTQDDLRETNHEEFYVSLRQFPFFPEYSLIMRTRSAPASLIESTKAKLRQMTASEPVYDVLPLSTRVADSISGPTFQSKLIGGFAGLALALAAFGLYGVLAFNVGRRTREIGIRMALGAPRRSVAGGMFLRGFAIVIPGLALGLAGAWLVGTSLQSQLFEVSINDPRTYVAALMPLLIAAALACWLPARRASKVDPVVALREE
ncbi:MAG TPA: ABC transporter permease [Terracidiphilus sp.]